MQKSDNPNFTGFRQPKANYSKLPHQFIGLLPKFKSLAELKCILYLLRHTWGYREYDKSKLISIDEFVHGRKRKDGTRIDAGTGLSEQGVRDGLETAMANGYILCHIDDSDKGRIKKFYKLNTATVKGVDSGVQSLDPQTIDLPPNDLDPNPQNSLPRTEKETKERNYKKNTSARLRDHSDEQMETRAITDLIQVFADVNKVAGNPYKKTGYRSSAKGLHDKGITPDELRAFLVEQKQGWAKNRAVTWTNVETNILTWKENKNPPPAAPIQYTPPANFNPMPAPIVIPAYEREESHD